MEPTRFLECLDADFHRMRGVVARDLDPRVPSCPEWNVAELVRHTAAVYLHKVECMRTGAAPTDWPPENILKDEPLGLFDRAYEELIAEFDKRKPEDASVTWYGPEQTVGFWIRRMAQETVIHRVDSELAAGETFAPIPDDLAIDGIDEILERFLAFGSQGWPDEFKSLPGSDLDPIAVKADGSTWTLVLTPKGVMVEREATDAKTTIEGDPAALLLWLWRRADGGVEITGDDGAGARLQELLRDATQ